ncbi:MAG: ankyrin repeat domain-containing protein [bacterium]
MKKFIYSLILITQIFTISNLFSVKTVKLPIRPLIQLSGQALSGALDKLNSLKGLGPLLQFQDILEGCSTIENLLNKQIKSGWTILMSSTKRGEKDNVEKLLELGADPDLKNNSEATALHIAAGNGNLNIVKLLVNKIKSLDSLDKNGSTPLMWACSFGHVEVITFLLNHGAKSTICNNENHSILMNTIECGNKDAVLIVLNHLIETGQYFYVFSVVSTHKKRNCFLWLTRMHPNARNWLTRMHPNARKKKLNLFNQEDFDLLFEKFLNCLDHINIYQEDSFGSDVFEWLLLQEDHKNLFKLINFLLQKEKQGELIEKLDGEINSVAIKNYDSSEIETSKLEDFYTEQIRLYNLCYLREYVRAIKNC